jgi:hypothetical protein
VRNIGDRGISGKPRDAGHGRGSNTIY